jgi:hypothetical protein
MPYEVAFPFHPASPGAEPSEPWKGPTGFHRRRRHGTTADIQPADIAPDREAKTRRPFSLRPNKQEAVVTVSGFAMQHEIACKSVVGQRNMAYAA